MSIEQQVEDVWSYFKSIDTDEYKLQYPSIPVLYSGDYDSYTKSSLKTITVGLNPSNKEFPPRNPFSRFYESEQLHDKEELSPEDTQSYIDSLNMYFNYNSNDWFENFEPILNAMNTSFFTGYPNTAIHTNLVSPLATSDSWSKYEDTTPYYYVQNLTQKGLEKWLKLIDILQPDIILTSLGPHYRKRIFIEQKLEWTLFEAFDKTAKGKTRRKPYEVHCSIARLPSGKKCLLAFGASNVVPFMISEEQKKVLGTKIYKLLTGKEPVQYNTTPLVEENNPDDIENTASSVYRVIN